MSSTTKRTIDATLTVNEVIRLYPPTVTVFGNFGIDSCCGGGLTLAEVVRRHRLDEDGLLAELRAAAEA